MPCLLLTCCTPLFYLLYSARRRNLVVMSFIFRSSFSYNIYNNIKSLQTVYSMPYTRGIIKKRKKKSIKISKNELFSHGTRSPAQRRALEGQNLGVFGKLVFHAFLIFLKGFLFSTGKVGGKPRSQEKST